MRDLKPTWTPQPAAVLSAVFLLTLGCDFLPPKYTPPGKDHEASGQVLWVDVYSEDPSYPSLDPPNEDRCLAKGFNLHSSRLRGTEREILTGAGSTDHLRSASDVAVRRSSKGAYWAARVTTGPPCRDPTDEVRIEQVSLTSGRAETVYEIDNEKNGDSDRNILALAVAGSHLVWTETGRLDETTAVLWATLTPDGESLQPDTLYETDGEAQALEAGPDAEAVYWNTSGGRLFRTDLGGETTRLSSSFSGQVEAIGGDPARIYWSSGSSLRSIALGGSGQRQDGTLPEGTTAIGLGPRGQRVFAGTEGENKEDEGIWMAPLRSPEPSQFDKCVGEGKSGDTISGHSHREDFRSPRSLTVLYDGDK